MSIVKSTITILCILGLGIAYLYFPVETDIVKANNSQPNHVALEKRKLPKLEGKWIDATSQVNPKDRVRLINNVTGKVIANIPMVTYFKYQDLYKSRLKIATEKAKENLKNKGTPWNGGATWSIEFDLEGNGIGQS